MLVMMVVVFGFARMVVRNDIDDGDSDVDDGGTSISVDVGVGSDYVLVV